MTTDKGTQHKFKRVKRQDRTFMYCQVCTGYAYIDAPSECPNRPLNPYESANIADHKLDLYGGAWLWEFDEIVPTPFVGYN